MQTKNYGLLFFNYPFELEQIQSQTFLSSTKYLDIICNKFFYTVLVFFNLLIENFSLCSLESFYKNVSVPLKDL